MKFILPLLNLLKKFGFIYRIIGVALAFGLIAEAIPDLNFNYQIKNIKNFTLKQV